MVNNNKTVNKNKFCLEANLNKLHGVLYLKSLDLSNPSSLAFYLKEDKNLPFDGPEAVIPIPADAPLEIPRIILRSKDGVFVCNISVNRVDLFFNETKEQSGLNPDDIIKKIKAYLKTISTSLKKDFNAKFHRIALVFRTINVFLN